MSYMYICFALNKYKKKTAVLAYSLQLSYGSHNCFICFGWMKQNSTVKLINQLLPGLFMKTYHYKTAINKCWREISFYQTHTCICTNKTPVVM